MSFFEKLSIFSMVELKGVLGYATTAYNHALGYWKSEFSKLIAPYKSFPAIQMRVSGENLAFLFSQEVIFVILQLKFRHSAPQ